MSTPYIAGPSPATCMRAAYGASIVLNRSYSRPNSSAATPVTSPSVRRECPDPRFDLLGTDHEPILEDVVVRHTRDIRPGDTRDRSVEVVERFFGDDRRDLRPV